MIIEDGFPTTIIFSLITNPGQALVFEEVEVTPPGLDAGGGIDTVSMRNVFLRTKAPKSLYTFTDVTVVVAYDPAIINQIRAAALNVGELTVQYANGDEIEGIFCFIDKFTPQAIREGERPLATLTFVLTNVNPGTGLETGFTYANAA